MKKGFLIIAVLFISAFSSHAVFANGKDESECILKNKEFCGVWHELDAYSVTIAGDRIIDSVPSASYIFTIIKEERFEDGRPISLLLSDVRVGATKETESMGIMLVMLPQDNHGEPDERINPRSMIMCEFSEHESTGPCFSHNPEERQSCNLPELFKQTKECEQIGYSTLVSED